MERNFTIFAISFYIDIEYTNKCQEGKGSRSPPMKGSKIMIRIFNRNTDENVEINGNWYYYDDLDLEACHDYE